MHQIRPQARTTPAVLADIARSLEPTSVLVRRYGISDETVLKWRTRCSDACLGIAVAVPETGLESLGGGACHCLSAPTLCLFWPG